MSNQIPVLEQLHIVRKSLSSAAGRRHFLTETLWAAPAVFVGCVGLLALVLTLAFVFFPANEMAQLQALPVGQLMKGLAPLVRQCLVGVALLTVPLAILGEAVKLVRQHVQTVA